jgi:hypothetical protein
MTASTGSPPRPIRTPALRRSRTTPTGMCLLARRGRAGPSRSPTTRSTGSPPRRRRSRVGPLARPRTGSADRHLRLRSRRPAHRRERHQHRRHGARVATPARLKRMLTENEASDRDIALVYFNQGVLTGDWDGPHVSPIAAYDADRGKVLIMDVDRQWYYRIGRARRRCSARCCVRARSSADGSRAKPAASSG